MSCKLTYMYLHPLCSPICDGRTGASGGEDGMCAQCHVRMHAVMCLAYVSKTLDSFGLAIVFGSKSVTCGSK